MSRKLTTYKRPSILNGFNDCKSFAELKKLRDVVLLGLQIGQIKADQSTVRKWEVVLFLRLQALMSECSTCGHLLHMLNTTRSWSLPAAVIAHADKLKQRFASGPDLLAASGITIEGISTPEQSTAALEFRRAVCQDSPKMAVRLFGKNIELEVNSIANQFAQ